MRRPLDIDRAVAAMIGKFGPAAVDVAQERADFCERQISAAAAADWREVARRIAAFQCCLSKATHH